MVQTKLYVALDFPNAEAALALYGKVRAHNPYFKIGLELFTAAGPDFVRKLVSDGAKIFLDLKFHDIPNTVAGAVRSASELGVEIVNIHLSGGREMVEAVTQQKYSHRPKLIGVTVLTSSVASPGQVLQMAKDTKAWGLDGVVCSAHELKEIHANCGSDFLTVVPGIRPANAAANDQKRIATPEEAAALGAHYIVVGRPVTQSPDPAAATLEILRSL